MKKAVVFIVFIFSIFCIAPQTNAQCSMCTINAENGSKNGNTQTKGINSGVLYLLSIPFLLAGGIGLVWYKNYRKSI